MAACDVFNTKIVQSKNQLMPTCSGKENLPPYDGVMYRTDFDTLPEIKFDGLFRFMVGKKKETASLTSFKALDRAVLHFHAGDVQDISRNIFIFHDDEYQMDYEFLYVRAKELASMKKIKYTVLAQSCSHIGGLLFAIKDYRQTASLHGDNLAYTSKLGARNVPRNITLDPKPISQLNLSKPRLPSHQPVTTRSCVEFDP
ncbi:hypothetical protein MAR_012633 [Mya arenaria]|uniref:Uncharacterized protein n=1 Tax=Mya arenaria TaxID=6604 RepID=A0ABY7G118_MYAAR|nr:hypothetical protein MAR_012633 [Mya arenaria]